MPTWLDFTDGVKAAYWTAGEPTASQQYRALANFAISLIIRQVERDLEASKSFLNSYNEQKLLLAGSRVTGNDAAVIAAVEALMPIERDTDGITELRENAILQARDDFNGTADRFDVELLNAAMDLQRHIPFYQARHETTYTPATVGLLNRGFVSEVALPDGCRIQNVWAGRLHTPLVAGTYVADDIVDSNGRFYKVTTGGTLTTEQIGDGLIEQQAGVEETLGDVVFEYYCDSKLIPVRPFPWADREAIYSGRLSGGPVWTTPPQTDVLWLYPAMVNDERLFMLEWSGVKTAFDDADTVTFDLLAYQAGAQYVRAMLLKDVADNGRSSAAALLLYQAALRKALIDNQARQTGTAGSSSELLRMNLGCVPWWRQCFMRCTSTSSQSSTYPSNSEYEQESSTGNVTVTAQSPNHLAKIDFTGVASTRVIVLNSNWQNPQGGTFAAPNGFRIVISATFPDGVADIIIEVRDSTSTGTLLLPASGYAGQQFTTDGFSTSAAWEFVSNEGVWQWVRGQVPA